MNTTAAGPEGTYLAGQVVIVDEVTAAAWISGGYASPAGEQTGDPAPAAKPARKGARARAAEPEPEASDTAEPPAAEE
jgi:hypothetical protein